MPSFKITDNAELEILSGQANPGSGLAKYLKGDVATFVASSALVNALNTRIDRLGTDELGLNLKFAQDGSFGTSGVDWKINAGARATVLATLESNKIPQDKAFSPAYATPEGNTFLGVSFVPTLGVGLEAGLGDLKFGFSAGASVDFTSGRLFPNQGLPNLGSALRGLFESAVIPGNALDVNHMREGDYGSVSGSGNLAFSANFDVARVINPLAIPNLPVPGLSSINVQAGLSLSVGASVGLSGTYQIRVIKLANQKAIVGVYRNSNSQFELEVKAEAGLSANMGKTELIARLLGLLGAPEVDARSLAESGLADEQIEDLKDAVESSLNRSLAVSLSGAFSTSIEDTRVFEYEFDLNMLGNAGFEALNKALQADLSPLTSLRTAELPNGVTLKYSLVEETRRKSIIWKINLLGIVNFISISELIRNGEMLFNAETGELVVTDTVTAKKISATTFPLAADPNKLHKLLLQSLMITAAYKASGTVKFGPELSASMTYFRQEARCSEKSVSNMLDNFTGLSLMTQGEKANFLNDKFSGRASIYLDASFGSQAMESMFFDDQGQPHGERHYEEIGRECVRELILPGDEGDYRRIPMLDNQPSSDLWQKLRDSGNVNQFRLLLPAPISDNPVMVSLIGHDYSVISWWAMAMSGAAKQILRMKTFLDETELDGEELNSDGEFERLRKKLNDALAKIATNALPDFLDAWGILAMDRASSQAASIRGILFTRAKVHTVSRP